jgi:hypothetical protein
MSTTLTIKAQAPYQSFQIGTFTVTADANGLISVPAGSDQVKALLNFGCVVIHALPTVDPHVNGALWNNNGTLTISAG